MNHRIWLSRFTAQKMKFSIKDFFSKCDQIHSFLRIWPHLQNRALIDYHASYKKGILLFLANREERSLTDRTS